MRLWNTATGEKISTLVGADGGIEEAAIDPRGRWLVAVGPGGAWRWDLTSKSTRGELIDRPSGALWSVAFSPDGRRLATAAEDGVVQLYDTASWSRQGDPFTVDVDFLSVAFTIDSARVLAGTGDGRVFTWDLATHAQLGAPIAAHGTNDVWELAMDPTGQRVATASSDGTVRVWSMADDSLVATPFIDQRGARSVETAAGVVWSADGGSLYAGGQDGRIHEWDFASATEVSTSTVGHDDRIVDAAASSDRRVFVTLGRDQDIRVWDAADRPPPAARLADFDVALFGLATSPDGATIAAGDGGGTVHVFRAGQDVALLTGHAGRVFGVALLPDGRLVTGDDGGTVRVWDVKTRRILSTSAAARVAITSLAVAADGQRVATAGTDGVVRVYSTRDVGEPTAETARAATGANKVVFAPSGELVAGYNDGQVRFWLADGGQARKPLSVDADGDAVFSIAVSPDGHTLAAATATDGLTLWDLPTRTRRSELNGQPIDPIDVAFVPDGTALVSATRVGTITLWNTANGQSIGPRFQYHSDAVWRVAVTSNATVVSASEDGSVRSLDVLDVDRGCELGAGALDRRARERYLGAREPVGCRG